MHYTSIEQMLQMTRGGTVSGRAPTIIGDQILDAKSGDGPQIDLAKESLFEAMRNAESPTKLSPEERTSLTEAELTELSTGDVNAVLAKIRSKLIKRGKPGRQGTLKNVAKHAASAIMSLGESNLKPGDMNQGSYADQKPRMIKSGYSLGEFALKGGSTKQAQTMQSGKHRGVDAGDPIGESKLPGGPLRSLQTKADWHAAWKNAAGNPEQMRHLQAIKTKRDPGGQDAGFHDFEIPGPAGVKEEAAMDESDTKKAASAAGERKFDTTWKDVESEASRIAGVASKTGLKAPLKEAIAAFQETVELSDALSEYNTAAGKVTGQKVYTDPVATMAINSAYRTDLLKLGSGKGAMAGKPGSVKSRDVKPGDPIGEDEIAEGSSGMRQLEKRRLNEPGMRAKQKFHDLRTSTASAIGMKNSGGARLPKSDLDSWESVRLAKRITSDARPRSGEQSPFKGLTPASRAAKARWDKRGGQ